MASDSRSKLTEDANVPINEDEVAFLTLVSRKENSMKADESLATENEKQELAEELLVKQQMLASVLEKKEKGPLQLLDLPMDVLKDIIKEVGPCFESSMFFYLTDSCIGHAY